MQNRSGTGRYWHSHLWLVVFLAVPVFLLSAWIVAGLVRQDALNEIQRTGKQHLQLYAANLAGELARYESIPALLATNQRVIKVLQQAQNYSAIQALNEYFEQAVRRTGALDIYLMNADGKTVAASNWQSERTFIGRNFSFRPYFKQAMQGEPGKYYALGTTSGVRGYYFSYPVMQFGKPIGVIVLKMDIERVEQGWGTSRDRVLLVDPDGIVFIANDRRWRYHSIRPLSDEDRRRLVASARYPGIDFKPLSSVAGGLRDGAETPVLSVDGRTHDYLPASLVMPDPGWRIWVLQPTDEADRLVRGSVAMVFAVTLVFSLLAILWLQSRARRQERLRCDAESRAALEQAHAELEQRVVLRTSDLQHEVEERRRAEEALRTAQDELVQAAKLAMLGQLSASINHELNQPLSAIRSYAENARLLLDRKRTGEAMDNLDHISRLVERMAQISSQLKLFARKSEGVRSPVSLRQSLEVCLKLLDADIRRGGVAVHVAAGVGDLHVLADATRLEQVLVNLVGNAVHALEGESSPRIVIDAEVSGGKVRISVQDNGPGVAQEHLEQIFDPFFTTRKSGLGLGLAISQQIVDNMGGHIEVRNAPEGGAVFVLTLEQAPHE